MFQNFQGSLGHYNKPGLTVFMQLYVASSATMEPWECALQIMVVARTFLKVHIFVKVFLLNVIYEGNNNQILISYAVVTFDIVDKWVRFRHQLELNFPASFVLISDHSKWTERK
jgi:hypothetical protein